MTDLWQIVITGAVVAAALSYVGYRVFKSWTGKRSSGCPSCSSCPEAEHSTMGTRKPLVMLEDAVESSQRGAPNENN